MVIVNTKAMPKHKPHTCAQRTKRNRIFINYQNRLAVATSHSGRESGVKSLMMFFRCCCWHFIFRLKHILSCAYKCFVYMRLNRGTTQKRRIIIFIYAFISDFSIEKFYAKTPQPTNVNLG